jgi:hypothetical protein
MTIDLINGLSKLFSDIKEIISTANPENMICQVGKELNDSINKLIYWIGC